MDQIDSWISFYEWKKQEENMDVEMISTKSSSPSSKHQWAPSDDTNIESSSTFPPYKGIILEDTGKVGRAVPLALINDFALGIDGRVQKVSEQINWTNISLKGLAIHSSTTSAQKEQVESISLCK